MPLLELSGVQEEGLDLSFVYPSSNDTTQPSSLDNRTPSLNNVAPTPLTSVPTPRSHPHPPSSTSLPSEASSSNFPLPQPYHLQRNYDRLKTRSQQAQRDNAEFREVNRENRTDIDRVDAIVEEVLSFDELSSPIFERLSQVSEILSCVRGRLR